jgi:alpha,alpha-trehalase
MLFLLITLIIAATTATNTCSIFCAGPILEAFQQHFIFGNDSKTFVDSPLREDPSVVMNAFNALPRPLNTSTLQIFAEQYFDTVGSDLIPWTPTDWKSAPPLLNHSVISQNDTLRNFTRSLNRLWLKLGRKPALSVRLHPERHTLLPTLNPIVVPGGRFRESYYWDSYWIIKGLLYSGMTATANGIVDNFVDFIESYGFVPNGGRSYYLTRSQPPLLSEMMRVLEQDMCGDPKSEHVLKRRSALEMEHTFWTNKRTTIIHFDDEGENSKNSENSENSGDSENSRNSGDSATAQTASFTSGSTLPATCNLPVAMSLLNHYDANTTLPRPESYREDVLLAKQASAAGMNASQLLRDIAAAAESGWDFSSRWFSDHATLLTIRTTRIIPVELNVVMARLEFNLCNMSNNLKSISKNDNDDNNDNNEEERGEGSADVNKYCLMAQQRWSVIEDCMWNETSSRWNDLVTMDVESRNTKDVENDNNETTQQVMVSQVVDVTSVANWMPLWGYYLINGLDSVVNSTRIGHIVQAALSLRDDSGLYFAAGLSTTTEHTEQQWDYPNAWAPLQDFIIDGLRNSAQMIGVTKVDAMMLLDFSTALSKRWLETNIEAWRKSGYMFEKYDAVEMGKGGGGGEYVPQIGFGWTNGVCFELLHSLE